ncbi:MAG: hypothetical protein A4S16_03480 [Proteobacteria bacterium SG_bin6]|nr:MAG: hypothetical protein A4S16_03480 [Proteobacteria bacterium SG_bin6]
MITDPRDAPRAAGGALVAQADRLPAHRPSLYRATYCNEVIEHMAEGFSIASFAGEIGVCRSTITNWQREHPEFAQAVAIGKAKASTWWEKRLREIAQGGGGPGASSAVQFGLKNQAPEDWRDVSTTEHTGRVGHYPMSRDEAIAEAERRGLPTQVYEP